MHEGGHQTNLHYMVRKISISEACFERERAVRKWREGGRQDVAWIMMRIKGGEILFNLRHNYRPSSSSICADNFNMGRNRQARVRTNDFNLHRFSIELDIVIAFQGSKCITSPYKDNFS